MSLMISKQSQHFFEHLQVIGHHTAVIQRQTAEHIVVGVLFPGYTYVTFYKNE